MQHNKDDPKKNPESFKKNTNEQLNKIRTSIEGMKQGCYQRDMKKIHILEMKSSIN